MIHPNVVPQPLSEGDYTPFVIGNEQAYKVLFKGAAR